MLRYKFVEITKYLHDGFRIDYPENKLLRSIYIDPIKIPENQLPADFILISHEHFDHMDKESIKKLLKESTVVIGNTKVRDGLVELELPNFVEMMPGESKSYGKLKISGRAAYNINKFREEGRPFHPKENNGLGFVLEITNEQDPDERIVIYHTGDSDFIEEMKEPMTIDILMVPVSGTYVMTATEASEATNAIEPNMVIPMHHDAGVAGSAEDAEVLRERVNVEVRVIEPVS